MNLLRWQYNVAERPILWIYRLVCIPGATIPLASLFPVCSPSPCNSTCTFSIASLTNEQIVAELGWTMIAIKAIIGITPNTFRPPYGDIDDRVRAIAKSMGLTPILWTGSGINEFDTDDWRIPGGTANGTSSFAAFSRILDLASQLTTGFIVLEHDLFLQTVDMAIGYFFPLAKQRSFIVRTKSHVLVPCIDTHNKFLAPTHQRVPGSESRRLIQRDLELHDDDDDYPEWFT